MAPWIPMAVLPSASVREPIAMDDIALLPPTDPRVKAAGRRQPRLLKFLRRFSDAFGQKVEPSVLMIREAAPQHFRGTSPVAGFRDAVSISVITGGRAVMVTHNSGMQRPIWAECLSIYPWMLDKFGEDLITNNSSMLGVHDLDLFRGQSVPGFSTAGIDLSDVDTPLFAELSRRWARRFGRENVEWEDRAIFRSLNMAYQASMMPGGQEATFYDIGRLITLWVSAMEILIHPGPGGGAYKSGVMDLLDSAPWCDDGLKALAHPVPKTKSTTQDRTLASLIYFRIDALRSDFMHGNDVTDEHLVTDNGTHLLHVAASLYRTALATKIGVLPPAFEDGIEFDEVKFLEKFSAYSDWKGPQRRHERAILKAMALPEGDEQ
ncbi:hypothetical protein N181_21385 [Sinorhizobium fredii USDA 205]|uniref:Apea-like HEPN domain-containing protein n=2 Tax=Rhizobium fredii TaxID=380 RepID=A0A844A9A2_RHIFR|nr:hypothetical protein [Sinorhizobium fredii]KSV86339.1 hypothetical protein N181_21385 [Sinorhizobium fredii USDA 205]MQX09679.1 hypothetical protein [Sinorhizobium fredii]GEC35376.1 hypothetical protein EFR01_55470 [Sinorhizobium fredii]GLS11570.1 hypothetical protein GCM10007864_52010 [Sinorhizobium fredii]